MSSPSPHPRSCRSCPAFARSAFANLTPDEIARLDAERVPADYSRHQTFSEKGKPAEEVYCLGAGSAKVTLFDALTNRESLVRLVGAGDLLGYRCIFAAETFRGTASALTPSRACRISKNFVMDLVDRAPHFSREMLKRMSLEVASAEYHHHSFCQKSVRERMAEALLILDEKFGENSEAGRRISTRLSRPELSNWVGAAKETVIRCLGDFTSEGLIRQIDGMFFITDYPRLAEISGAVRFLAGKTNPASPTP